jgi:hypothetical protein
LEEDEGSGEEESESEEEEQFEHDDLLPVEELTQEQLKLVSDEFDGSSFLSDMQKLREMREK